MEGGRGEGPTAGPRGWGQRTGLVPSCDLKPTASLEWLMGVQTFPGCREAPTGVKQSPRPLGCIKGRADRGGRGSITRVGTCRRTSGGGRWAVRTAESGCSEGNVALVRSGCAHDVNTLDTDTLQRGDLAPEG